MFLLVFYLAVALLVSFICSIMEATLLSITPAFVVSMADSKDEKLAALVLALKTDIDRPLAAILSLNTIAHTIGAAGVGAQVQVIFGNTYVTIASILLTLAILVLSEIIPKTLGALHWRKLTPVVAHMLRVFIWIAYPFVVLSIGITKMLSSGRPHQRVSREEIHALSKLGAQEGILDESETQILRNLFVFREVRVADVMTPRTVMFAFPESMTVGEVIREHSGLPFSRIIIYDTDPDSCTGYVLRHEILHESALDRHKTPLSALKREIQVVPESLSLQRLFEQLLENKEQIALVIDEYGGTAGVATMEDIVETLIGMEIVDEVDTVQDMQELARQRWRSRAKRMGILPENDTG